MSLGQFSLLAISNEKIQVLWECSVLFFFFASRTEHFRIATMQSSFWTNVNSKHSGSLFFLAEYYLKSEFFNSWNFLLAIRLSVISTCQSYDSGKYEQFRKLLYTGSRSDPYIRESSKDSLTDCYIPETSTPPGNLLSFSMSVMATNFEIVPNKSGKASVWAHLGFVKELGSKWIKTSNQNQCLFRPLSIFFHGYKHNMCSVNFKLCLKRQSISKLLEGETDSYHDSIMIAYPDSDSIVIVVSLIVILSR